MAQANYATPYLAPFYRWYVATSANTVVAVGYLRAQWGDLLVRGHYWTNVFTHEAYRYTEVDIPLIEHAISEVVGPITAVFDRTNDYSHDLVTASLGLGPRLGGSGAVG